jgi:hypothetical protein
MRKILALFLVLFVSACGGGSGSPFGDSDDDVNVTVTQTQTNEQNQNSGNGDTKCVYEREPVFSDQGPLCRVSYVCEGVLQGVPAFTQIPAEECLSSGVAQSDEEEQLERLPSDSEELLEEDDGGLDQVTPVS